MPPRRPRPATDDGPATDFGPATGTSPTTDGTAQHVAARILAWYDTAERALPWRAPGHGAWGVYVSEVMAQQTQVARVAEVWPAWMQRWPSPAALAASSPAEVVRQWGRLGYPRRALWMHAAATAMVLHHGGQVPRDADALRALPGVGEYTAAAIRAFAFGERVAVLDVNVRRVHARAFFGSGHPAPSVTLAERAHHERFLPADALTAAHLSQAVMEFGAVVCTARAPQCASCPIADSCACLRGGSPTAERRPRKQAVFVGSDRQCRGALMQVLRDAHAAVPASALEGAWTEALQRQRCLDALIADGLVKPLAGHRFALPG